MDQSIQFDAWTYPRRRVAERLVTHATAVTVIEAAIRSKLDAATSEYFSSVHTDSVNDAIRVVRETAARAFIVSPNAVPMQELAGVRQAITRCPGLITVALIGDHEPKAVEGLLTLGTQGVRRIVDLSYPDGWSKLRTLITESGGEIAKVILEAIAPALGETSDGTRYFFECLVHLAPTVVTAKQLACELDIGIGALTSRFYRAGLPAPKPPPAPKPGYPLQLNHLGDHVRKHRMDLSLNRKETAAILGTTGWSLKDWEEGNKSPRIDFYPRIIDWLACNPSPKPKSREAIQRERMSREMVPARWRTRRG